MSGTMAWVRWLPRLVPVLRPLGPVLERRGLPLVPALVRQGLQRRALGLVLRVLLRRAFLRPAERRRRFRGRSIHAAQPLSGGLFRSYQ